MDTRDTEEQDREPNPHEVERQIRVLRQIPDSLRAFYSDASDPDTNRDRTIWYRKVPTSAATIARSRVAQRQLIVSLIAAVRVLRRNQPPDASHHRVVAIISVPDFHSSEIAVFFDDDAFHAFIDRRSDHQTWTPLPPNRSLCAEWQIPPDLEELGFAEVVNDEDERQEGEVWFLGDVATLERG